MTWSKYGSEYSDELANSGVSDAAYRTHTEAIGWLYRVEDLKLRIPKHLVRRFAGSEEHEAAAKELADLGIWRDHGDTWEIIHHAEVIRSSVQAQRQKRDRDKRAQSARRKRVSGAAEAGPVSGDVSADVATASADDSAATQTVRQTAIHRPATRQRRSA